MACCMLSNFRETSRAHWSQGDDLRSATNQMNQGIQKMNGSLNDHLLFKMASLKWTQISMIWPPHQHPKNHGVQPTHQGASWESTVTMRKLTTPTKPAVMNLKSAGAAGGFFFTFGLPSSDVLKMCWPCNTAGAIFLLGPYWILLTNLQRESTHKFYTFHHFLEDGAHSLKHSFSFCVTYEAKLITTFNRKTTWHHHSRHADLCAGPLNTFTSFATQPCNVTAQMM